MEAARREVVLLDKLKEAFFQWQSISTLEEDLAAFLCEIESCITFQQELARLTFQSDLFNKFLPEPGSEFSFWKRIIRQLEGQDEVLDIIYERFGELSARGAAAYSGGKYYKTYFFGLDPTLSVSLRETREIISQGTTGLSSWEAGRSLAGWISCQDVEMFRNRTILELGAGSGISGIVALKKWPQIKKYIFTDFHEKVLENLEHNIEANLVDMCRVDFLRKDSINSETDDQPFVTVTDLDWEMVRDDEPIEKVDLIVGADIVFDKDLIPSLVNAIR